MHASSEEAVLSPRFLAVRRFPICVLSWVIGACPLATNAAQRASVGPGFVQELAASLTDVQQALDDVLQDETIHGTYIFDKERTLTGAKLVSETPLFEPWKGTGTVLLQGTHAGNRPASLPRKR